MRVLLWTQHYWPEHFAINAVAADLVRRGVHVTVLTGKPNYPEGKLFPGYQVMGIVRERHDGVDIIRIPMRPRGFKSIFGLAFNYLSFIVSGYLFAGRALRDLKPDLVFVYATSPILQALPALHFARRRRIPLVLWVQDLWPEAIEATGYVNNTLIKRIISALVRVIYRRADSILVQSEAFAEPVRELGGGANLYYHPNSVAVSAPTLSASAAANALAADIGRFFSVVFTGNVGMAQSMETVVAAAGMLSDTPGIRIYIVGSGSALKSLEKSAQGLDNLVICGRFPATDMPKILGVASALLVILGPNLVGEKTVPAKIQSYLAAGRPIIACMNGEGARIVEASGAGVTCPAGDPAALATAIRKLHALDEHKRVEMGKNGYQYFENHFEAGRINSALLAHFNRVVGEMFRD